jgi:hypothetical protein
MANQKTGIYRTAKGREVDMGKLINQNELQPAVGNMKVNARGDKLGPGGKIISSGIPSQINLSRPAPAPAPVPVATPVPAPVAVTSKKDVSDMDPEGNE